MDKECRNCTKYISIEYEICYSCLTTPGYLIKDNDIMSLYGLTSEEITNEPNLYTKIYNSSVYYLRLEIHKIAKNIINSNPTEDKIKKYNKQQLINDRIRKELFYFINNRKKLLIMYDLFKTKLDNNYMLYFRGSKIESIAKNSDHLFNNAETIKIIKEQILFL